MADVTPHLIYAAAWASFGLGHSLFARDGFKRRVRPLIGAAYRIAYNAVAAIHLVAVFGIGTWAYEDATRFSLPPYAEWATLALTLSGWVLLLVALRGYDTGRLIGVRQLRAARLGIEEPEDEPLRRDGVHRYVRHPLYTAAFMILWGQALGPFGLATALWASAYLLIGTWFEERALCRLYGPAYAEYRRCVPAFLPWRGRAF